jgi:hypothetical protein
VTTKTTCAGCRRKISHFLCNDPDRCPTCYEPITGFVSGAYRCRCEQPRMPRNLRDNARDDRPSAQVRYGN